MSEQQAPGPSSDSLAKALGLAGSAWAARSARRQAAEAALLVSDEEELDTRTSSVLAARTRGELDEVLRDLGGLVVLVVLVPGLLALWRWAWPPR